MTAHPGQPRGSALTLALARVYRLERGFVAWTTAFMGLVVFLDVIHRVASRERGLLVRFFGEENQAWANPVGTALGMLVMFVAVFAALVIRGRPREAKTGLLAVAIVAVGYGAVRLFLVLMPNGLIWSQTLGLVLMLWIGLIGASMATHEHRHLALDLGSKLWPPKVLPYVQALGNLVTSAFCLAMALLAVLSLRDHFGDWSDTDGAGGIFVAFPLPKWLAFTIVPLGFGLMALRFLLLAGERLRGQMEEDDPLHMLGLEDGSSGAKPEALPAGKSVGGA